MTDLHDLAARIRYVLVRTSHPGNIGSAARAIRTMGFTRLELVTPYRFPDPEAHALAAGADDVLASAGIHRELVERKSVVSGKGVSVRGEPGGRLIINKQHTV